MDNMDKGITVPKWALTVWPKIPQMPQNLSAQFACPRPKVLDFNEERLHWASVVCGYSNTINFIADYKNIKSDSVVLWFYLSWLRYLQRY